MKNRAKLGIWLLVLLCAHLFFHPLVHSFRIHAPSTQASFDVASSFDPSATGEEQCGVCNILHSLLPALLLLALLFLAPQNILRVEAIESFYTCTQHRRLGRAPPSLL